MLAAVPSPRLLALRCPICGERRDGREGDRCERDDAVLVPRAADPMLGEVLGGAYRIAAPMARGGMGLIYRGRHVRLERDVAVKVLSPNYANNELALRRFYREVEALARVRSPHVVHVLDAVQAADGRPCLITEYLEGEDLQKRLTREGRLPLVEALEIAHQLATALIAVHDEGVLHRDLKPSNVFICTGSQGDAREDRSDELGNESPSGTQRSTQGTPVHVRLLDFGVARVESAGMLTRDGAVVGTPAYMAPEQVRGARNASVQGDIYGVGAVLYRAITGHPPYASGPATQVLASVLEGSPQAPSSHVPSLPLSVEAFLLRAMARNPEDRFRSARALKAAIKDLLVQHGKRAAWSRRGKGTSLLAAGAVGAMSGLAALPLAQALIGSHGAYASALCAIGPAIALARRSPEHVRPFVWAAGAYGLAVGIGACVGLLPLASAPYAAAAALVTLFTQWSRSTTNEPLRSTQAECTASTMTPSSSVKAPASQRTPARARS